MQNITIRPFKQDIENIPPDSEEKMPQLEETMLIRTSTVDFIPSSCKDKFCRTLISIMSDATFNNTEEAWMKYLLFPKIILWTKEKEKDSVSIAVQINKRLDTCYHSLEKNKWLPTTFGFSENPYLVGNHI